MADVMRLAQWIRCGVIVGTVCLGCGGEVALNGLAPVDAAAPDGPAQDTSSNPPSPGADASSNPPSPGADASIHEASSEPDAGPPPAECGVATCGGCCDDKGYCQSGDVDDECGLRGEACAACAATSRVCSQGQCSSPVTPPACNHENCGGCCDATGACRGGQSLASCGTRASACVDCSLSGDVCTGGSCRPYDSGPPCVVSACAPCIPVVQAACCTSDQTCGCEVVLPDGGGACQ